MKLSKKVSSILGVFLLACVFFGVTPFIKDSILGIGGIFFLVYPSFLAYKKSKKEERDSALEARE